jgi:DNA-binding response OmpR family regulator
MNHYDPSRLAALNGAPPMRTLLLADRSLADSLRPPLEKEGVLVDAAEQAALADVKVQTGCYDAMFLAPHCLADFSYPRLLAWRRGGLRAHVVVLLPGDCNSAERVRALDAGADGYLLPPFSVEELRAHLRALSRHNALAAGSVFQTHDLEIDPASRTARRGGRCIPLTAREFDLLEFLAQHQGQVVSRAAIRKHLYPDQQGRTSNVVDVYIRYLRNKIDKGFDTPLILTRWGQGYLLCPRGA